MALKKKLLWTVASVVGVVFTGASVYAGMILFGNYAIDEQELVMSEVTSVVDSEGEMITRMFAENRELVDLDDVPEHVQDAFIAVEDRRFYDHTGIDFRAIGRALYRDLLAGSMDEGGSTITQQLAKNAFLSPEKSLMRKTEEALIAINLEKRYTKDELLGMYLNQIYFGHGAYGIQSAAKLYFDKDVSELEVHEGALLAALPKGPNNYSPFQDEERSLDRRNLVLNVMEQNGYITAEEAVSYKGRTLPSEMTQWTSNPAYNTYVDMILNEAENEHGLSEEEVLSGGYTIEVAMDSAMQEETYHKMTDGSYYPEGGPEQQVQGTAVFLDNDTGGVAAVQGGRDYERKGLNRVTRERQPGSTFKPLAVYAPVLEENVFEPYSLLKDEPTDFDGYSPRNVNESYEGERTVYDALKDSANVPAVWALNELGLDQAKPYLEEQGITFADEGLSVALGGLSEGITPLDLAASYRTFINGGSYSEPYFIESITDRDGETIVQREEEEKEIYSEQTAWDITRMLEAVVDDGTGTAGTFNGPLAGKTGTTQLEGTDGASRDLWFSGFTPEFTGAVWMGFDSSDEDHRMYESSALPTAMMKAILTDAYSSIDNRATAFEQPDETRDLEEPIRLVNIQDLEADVSMSLTGQEIELTWSESEDNRLKYRIYEMDGDGRELIEEVRGTGEYTVKKGYFGSSDFVVVPYNPQAEEEGEPSNVVEAGYSLFSSGEAS
ncbi:transglycosylase domain-containing protein [Salisediminibacterium halotolerans]|uniref:Penicillin-binding protein 2A n=1 Tax=Salisediminibacterium halotolerans TaxID=517425 RepID=A0A1H9TG38_9BACI|nr:MULTISPECIES: PBP1A family penicillin-binding protein [Salisediminibacterium]RLJ78403.1 penicillin-binding protein 2A [Actinophytocola xinjiangensis]RPE85618.1 penicillin-binding protein 2A [Salisediminibacterium halotolerans]TWG37379.1 penicillin-binding protein 2A [Salisediminibacterium halotolerans]SER96172.1 penicillin-binding protein 2A [Salisediminibacterium haloalkalitolerans]GEL08860.1 penicillin-binding protein 1F [Salisediminibacterium halotolerans]